MNPDVTEFAQVMAVLVPSIVILLGAVVAGYWLIRRGSQPRAALSSEDSRRLERLEQAIDAVAVEVERISEGQRFTTKLLADKSTGQEPQAAARIDGR